MIEQVEGYPPPAREFHSFDSALSSGIALFGAGPNGELILDYMKKNGYKVNCFIDNSPRLQNTKIEDIPVLSPNDFFNKNNYPILVTARQHNAQILKTLESYKLKMSFYAWFYLKNKLIYDKLETIFEDNKSIDTLKAIIQTMLTSENSHCANIVEHNTYFCLPGFSRTANEIYVDLGAYVGDTMERFISLNDGSFKHIYAFEPGDKQFIAAKHRLKRLSIEWALNENSITLINAGVSDKTKILSIHHNEHLAMLSLSQKAFDGCDNNIKVYSLDDYFKDTPVTFIKADIEGAEVDMLHGAEKVIKRDKPKIAISVYHRPDDFIKIVEILRKFVPDYKFALRNHLAFLGDTVLYCWV